jgi:hypothetical protein
MQITNLLAQPTVAAVCSHNMPQHLAHTCLLVPATCCYHVTAAVLACCSFGVLLPAVCVAGLCRVGCHLEVLLLATLTDGVQEQRQAWGVAGTSPPHTVLVR